MDMSTNSKAILHIGTHAVGRGLPTFIIAEIGNNHNGDMDLALKSVEAAKLAGANAVKFQKRFLNEVFTQAMLDQPQTSSRGKLLGATYGEYRRRLELNEDQLVQLRDYAHSLGLAFFVTPFDLKSVELLSRIGMDAWKIASFDLTHLPLIETVSKLGKPVILSTGMARREEIDEASSVILRNTNELIVLHCVSVYPTPDKELNLGAITTMQQRYAVSPIGYSGHEVGFIPTIAAVALGACVVERHFTLDKTLPGPDHATVSLDLGEFSEMVRQIRRIESAVADRELYLHEAELAMRKKHGKSLVAAVAISAGTVVTLDLLRCKSPGVGISPLRMHTVIGRRINVDLPADQPIMEEHIDWNEKPLV